jgi:hypothetical protein
MKLCECVVNVTNITPLLVSEVAATTGTERRAPKMIRCEVSQKHKPGAVSGDSAGRTKTNKQTNRTGWQLCRFSNYISV